MSRKRRLSSKRLLAVRVRALVGAAAGMSAAVASQRAAVSELLCASLASMRLLARVNTLVNRKGRSLDELLIATGKIARMGSDSRMNAFCTRKCQQLNGKV